MKAFLVLCLVCAVYAENLDLASQQDEAGKKFEAECIKESKFYNNLLEEFKKGNFLVNEMFDKFFLCFFKKSGILNEDGKINIELAVSKLPRGANKDQAMAALNICKDVTGKDPAETVGNVLRCYYDKTNEIF